MWTNYIFFGFAYGIFGYSKINVKYILYNFSNEISGVKKVFKMG